MRRLETVTDGAVRLPGGSVYPVLRVLEAEGLVTRRQVSRRGRASQVYALTDLGRAQGESQRAAMLALLGVGRG